MWVEVEVVALPVGHFEQAANSPVSSSGEQTSNGT
jgi:hypothetical protein